MWKILDITNAALNIKQFGYNSISHSALEAKNRVASKSHFLYSENVIFRPTKFILINFSLIVKHKYLRKNYILYTPSHITFFHSVVSFPLFPLVAEF